MPEAPYTTTASKRSSHSGHPGASRARAGRPRRARHQASNDSSRPHGATASAASTISRKARLLCTCVVERNRLYPTTEQVTTLATRVSRPSDSATAATQPAPISAV
jgi:hypothetical protein